MSYSSLINSNLNKAFNLVKDLAVDATFTKRSDKSFNFATRTVKSSSGETITTKIIVLDSKKPSKDRNTVTQQIMLKTAELGDLSLYDSIMIGTTSWKLGKFIRDDGFINIVELEREN